MAQGSPLQGGHEQLPELLERPPHCFIDCLPKQYESCCCRTQWRLEFMTYTVNWFVVKVWVTIKASCLKP